MTYKTTTTKKSRAWCPTCNAPVRMSLDSFPAYCGTCYHGTTERAGTPTHYLVLDDDGETYITQMEQWERRQKARN